MQSVNATHLLDAEVRNQDDGEYGQVQGHADEGHVATGDDRIQTWSPVLEVVPEEEAAGAQ